MYRLATTHSVTDRQTDDSIMPVADREQHNMAEKPPSSCSLSKNTVIILSRNSRSSQVKLPSI